MNDEFSNKRQLEEENFVYLKEAWQSDQIMSLGYETENPYLNLGSLVVVIACYLMLVLIFIMLFSLRCKRVK